MERAPSVPVPAGGPPGDRVVGPRRWLPLGPAGTNRRGPAVAGVLVLFAAGWGSGVLGAVLDLLAPVEPGSSDWLGALEAAAWELPAAALLVWAAVMFAGTQGAGPAQLGLARPRSRADWRAEAGVAGADVALSLAAFALGTLVGSLVGVAPAEGGDPSPEWTGADHAVSLLTSVLAGPTEEVVLLAVTVTVLRRARFSWGAVLVVATVLRVSFHAYYGWAALGLVVWAAGLVLVYARTGRVLGIVVSHALWNVTGELDAMLDTAVFSLVFEAAALVCLVVAVRAGVFTRADPPTAVGPGGVSGRGPARRTR